jgi:hypothetical protein
MGHDTVCMAVGCLQQAGSPVRQSTPLPEGWEQQQLGRSHSRVETAGGLADGAGDICVACRTRGRQSRCRAGRSRVSTMLGLRTFLQQRTAHAGKRSRICHLLWPQGTVVACLGCRTDCSVQVNHLRRIWLRTAPRVVGRYPLPVTPALPLLCMAGRVHSSWLQATLRL